MQEFSYKIRSLISAWSKRLFCRSWWGGAPPPFFGPLYAIWSSTINTLLEAGDWILGANKNQGLLEGDGSAVQTGIVAGSMLVFIPG